jgi:hypothetical protein
MAGLWAEPAPLSRGTLEMTSSKLAALEIRQSPLQNPDVEPLLFLVCLVVVPPLVAFYRRYWAAVGDRHPTFERWCEGRPLVAALFVPGGVHPRHVDQLASRLRGRFVNEEGCFPFSSYDLRLVPEKLDTCVLAVRVAGWRLRRGVYRDPPLLSSLLEAMGELVVEGVSDTALPPAVWEEGWLHGTLYRGEELESLDGGSWRFRPFATVLEAGEAGRGAGATPVLRGYRELPFWLRQRPPQPPRDGREMPKESRVLAVFGESRGAASPSP